jgi:hypothetical protein
VKPNFAVAANVNVGIHDFKGASRRSMIERSRNKSWRRGYSYVLWTCLLLLNGVANCTEIVIKVVGDSIFVAADSRGIQGEEVFDTCKILQIGQEQYFSFAGPRGLPIYDIRKVARDSVTASIINTDARFTNALIPFMTDYARQNGLIGGIEFASTAFYGIQNGKPTIVRRRFTFPLMSNTMLSESVTCPPSCDKTLQIGDSQEFEDLATRYVNSHLGTVPEALDCVVRAAIPSHAGVGGEVSVAKIDAQGLTWINGGACKTGPNEQRRPRTPDPSPCSLTIPIRK